MTGPAPLTTTPTAPTTDDHCLWTVDDVARYLRLSKSWVYQAVASGTFPCLRIGSAVRFDPETVRRYVRGELGGKVVTLPACR